MPRPRRIRVLETQHYVKFRLVDDLGPGERGLETSRGLELRPPLLTWVARARLLGAIAR